MRERREVEGVGPVLITGLSLINLDPPPLTYLTVFKLMSTSPSDHAPPPSSTPNSGHAATPEESRGVCMMYNELT